MDCKASELITWKRYTFIKRGERVFEVDEDVAETKCKSVFD
jgi:hypothetical protein